MTEKRKRFYLRLALAVDALHVLVILFWLGGYIFYPFEEFKTLRHMHSAFAVTIVGVQALLSCRCPLTIISGHLRAMVFPDLVDNWFYKPLTIRLLKWFGLKTPGIVITVTTILGATLALVAVLWIDILTT
ncbi:hypothetical protein CO174_04595 [Candidatus Uhrbacteria bacterium CG_4_9_14_3_um_filter_50_9]|uniref:DUF2784 domain-containing protein n=1 Tax=Candidatus Uhrbacteria bacterium CG_4_9_14_3_um_filter_50_9 TaxID=1975035 RepID=A0A2M7XB24_9BACT|nr:MAG: hypothetical protein CO174_04595 [Candidatus Uhrbacteria bacterium CG_4_9_14_3_um_filter_50_9]